MLQPFKRSTLSSGVFILLQSYLPNNLFLMHVDCRAVFAVILNLLAVADFVTFLSTHNNTSIFSSVLWPFLLRARHSYCTDAAVVEHLTNRWLLLRGSRVGHRHDCWDCTWQWSRHSILTQSTSFIFIFVPICSPAIS